jgi:hypothetical protein
MTSSPSQRKGHDGQRRKIDSLKRASIVVAVTTGLVSLGMIVFNSGRGIGRLDAVADRLDILADGQERQRIQVGHILDEVTMQTVRLEQARQDQDRVEAKVQLVAEALATRNRWSNKASDDIVRRLNALNHKGTHVLEDRP